jgi:hypothetical protein
MLQCNIHATARERQMREYSTSARPLRTSPPGLPCGNMPV